MNLRALDDDWYQDVELDGLAEALRQGISWEHEATGQQWLLSGREVFVLNAGSTHRGYVSCSGLAIGREHVVVCTRSRLSSVEKCLNEAGCEHWTEFTSNDGVPTGWVALRDVVPTRSAPRSNSHDILNVLRPLPEIEIALTGGVRLGYNTWLAGHPPSIHVYGDSSHAQQVTIDGREAALLPDSSFTVPGWDDFGAHQVWCGGKTTTYSLVRCETDWHIWPAYCFNEPGNPRRDLVICGPIVCAGSTEGSSYAPVIQIARTNPILLGARPGEIFDAAPPAEMFGPHYLAGPPFAAVWALPACPLLCDKRSNRILFLDRYAEAATEELVEEESGSILRARWWRAILDASRKGLPVEPDRPDVLELWQQYKAYARRLWKSR